MLGHIYHDSKDPESEPPKPKFYIVIGVCEDGSEFATVYINTDINPNVINAPDLVAVQREIDASGVFKFLNGVSFIDCSRTKNRLTSTHNRRVSDGHVTYKGTIPGDLLEEIKRLLRSSELMYEFYLEYFQI